MEQGRCGENELTLILPCSVRIGPKATDLDLFEFPGKSARSPNYVSLNLSGNSDQGSRGNTPRRKICSMEHRAARWGCQMKHGPGNVDTKSLIWARHIEHGATEFTLGST
jgi:hypothetical protein